MGRDYDNANNPDYRLTNRVEDLERKVTRLQNKLDALAGHLEIDFVNVPERPAYVAAKPLPKTQANG